jgi:Bacterial Ig-like domain (group 1)
MYATVTAGSATDVSVVSGNSQTAPVSTALPVALVVSVVDQFNNPVSGAAVTFSDTGAGGSFSASPATTDITGKATVTYTLPSTPQTVNITASVGGPAVSFTETAQ